MFNLWWGVRLYSHRPIKHHIVVGITYTPVREGPERVSSAFLRKAVAAKGLDHIRVVPNRDLRPTNLSREIWKSSCGGRECFCFSAISPLFPLCFTYEFRILHNRTNS